MTTAFAKTIQDRKAASEQAAIEAEFSRERDRVVAELDNHERRLVKEIPPFVKAIDTAQAAVDAARAKLDQAEAALRDAYNAKRQAQRAIEHPRDQLRARLETELVDDRITQAIAELDAMVEECRTLAPNTDDREFHASLTKRLNWITHTGRPAVLELRFVAGADIEPGIESVLADLPTIGG